MAKASNKNEAELIDVVVETPKGRRNKFKYDPKMQGFRLGSVLPAGLSFPYDFGFVPNTKAADGDPLDVLLLMDEPAYPGCHVRARIIGIIEAEQSEDGKMIRNDRVIAVAQDAHDYGDLKTAKDINSHLLQELECFFMSYNETRGKKFRMLGTRGPKKSMKVIKLATNSKKRKQPATKKK